RVQVREWPAVQKPATRALPRAIRSGVASTSRSGTGALRAYCLTVPTIVSAAANDTATANTAASPITPHESGLDPESAGPRPHQRRGSGKHCRQAKDVSHRTSPVFKPHRKFD